MDDLTVNPGSEGCVRTYYGEVLSQISISTNETAGGARVHSTAAHLVGAKNQNAHELLHINDQPYPWLFKIGVV